MGNNVLSLVEAIRSATLNGAHAICIAGSHGNIEKGKVANLVILANTRSAPPFARAHFGDSPRVLRAAPEASERYAQRHYQWLELASLMTEDTRDVYEHILSLLEAEAATSVVDLGCGRGEQLRMLGDSMTSGARLVGLDFRENVLEEARSAAGDDPRFVFLHHDMSEGLPFEDGELDRVLSVNALEAVSEKEPFVREVHRVLKPDGKLVCAHYDWASQLYDGPDKKLIRRIVEGSAESKLSWMTTNDGWMGRRLWGTFEATGLFEGRVDAYTHTSTRYEPGCHGWEWSRHFKGLIKRGVVAHREYEAFIQGLEGLAARGRYFYAITMFSYVAEKRAQ